MAASSGAWELSLEHQCQKLFSSSEKYSKPIFPGSLPPSIVVNRTAWCPHIFPLRHMHHIYSWKSYKNPTNYKTVSGVENVISSSPLGWGGRWTAHQIWLSKSNDFLAQGKKVLGVLKLLSIFFEIRLDIVAQLNT